MKCEIEKARLHLFFDNQLDEEESNYIQQHIKKCKECSNEIEFLSFLKTQFTKQNNVKISKQLFSNLAKIDKNKFSFIGLIKDIVKLVFKNKSGIFQIDFATELLLREKYPCKIIRWVFYC